MDSFQIPYDEKTAYTVFQSHYSQKSNYFKMFTHFSNSSVYIYCVPTILLATVKKQAFPKNNMLCNLTLL